ncbi:MAG: putative metal-binding motif-containing protein, partial [Aquificaceae bacterium]|nr:putative metal-binding motif-containing protein [Aquificaceae bacterium]
MFLIRFGLLLFLFTAFGCARGCKKQQPTTASSQQTLVVSGTLKSDIDGSPIQGADIIVEQNGRRYETKTDDRGQFAVEITDFSTEHDITVSAKGQNIAPTSKVITARMITARMSETNGMVTGRMVTGRMVTGRMVTARISVDIGASMVTGRFVTGRVAGRTPEGIVTGRMVTGRSPQIASRILMKEEEGRDGRVLFSVGGVNLSGFPGGMSLGSGRVLVVGSWFGLHIVDQDGNIGGNVGDEGVNVKLKVPEEVFVSYNQMYGVGQTSVGLYRYDGQVWRSVGIGRLINVSAGLYFEGNLRDVGFWAFGCEVEALACVEGRVRDEQGRGIGGLWVGAKIGVMRQNCAGYTIVESYTDEEGRYRIYVPESSVVEIGVSDGVSYYELERGNLGDLFDYKVLRVEGVRTGCVRAGDSEFSSDRYVEIRGRVVDQGGGALGGVRILDGRGRAVITGLDGRFSLYVKKGQTVLLGFSYRGAGLVRNLGVVNESVDLGDIVLGSVVSIRGRVKINGRRPGDISDFVGGIIIIDGVVRDLGDEGTFDIGLYGSDGWREGLVLIELRDGGLLSKKYENAGKEIILMDIGSSIEIAPPVGISVRGGILMDIESSIDIEIIIVYDKKCVEGYVIDSQSGLGLQGYVIGGGQVVQTDRSGYYRIEQMVIVDGQRNEISAVVGGQVFTAEVSGAVGDDCEFRNIEVNVDRVEIRGRVVKEGGVGIRGARVELVGYGQVVQSGEGGAFNLSVVGARGKLFLLVSYGDRNRIVEVELGKEERSKDVGEIEIAEGDVEPRLWGSVVGGRLLLIVYDDGGIVSYRIRFSGGEQISGQITLQGGRGQHLVDLSGRTGEIEVEIEDEGGNVVRGRYIYNPSGVAPEIVGLNVPGLLGVGQEAVLWVVVYDADGERYDVRWLIKRSGSVVSEYEGELVRVVIGEVGDYDVEVVVRDQGGRIARLSVAMRVQGGIQIGGFSGSGSCVAIEWYKDMDNDLHSDGEIQISCYGVSGYRLSVELVSLYGDCDDSLASVNPGAPLNCNDLLDNDCSGYVERWVYTDADGDRYAPSGVSACVDVVSYPGMITVGSELGLNDCNDSVGSIYPGAPLNCNDLLDNDCSGHVERWYYEDRDRDSWTTAVSQCANVMPSGFTVVSNPLDCNDSVGSIYPGAPLNCNNGMDNDCSGVIDQWGYVDADGDRYAPSSVSSCMNVVFPGSITVGSQLGFNDCNDSVGSIYPGAPLNCNDLLDNDCSGYVERWAYTDADGDRYAPSSISACVDVVSYPGRITAGSELGLNDCNDSVGSIYPGAPLNCNNGMDNDCSGVIDQWGYVDADGDRYAPSSVSSCMNVVFPGSITV